MPIRRPIRLPVALTISRSRATGRRRLQAQLEQANAEIALLREELYIKDSRWERSRSRRRPHYTPTQRMRILQLRAARGWTLEKTARIFLFDLETLHWRAPARTVVRAARDQNIKVRTDPSADG